MTTIVGVMDRDSGDHQRCISVIGELGFNINAPDMKRLP